MRATTLSLIIVLLPAIAFAEWDTRFGLPGTDGTVWAIARDDASVYVAGEFGYAGGKSMPRIVRWDGKCFSPLGNGLTGGYVYALAVGDGLLYAGGTFTAIGGGSSVGYIARWDGGAWLPLGDGLNGSVYAIAIVGTDVYVGGAFTTAGSVPAGGIARWDGSAWTSLNGGVTLSAGTPVLYSMEITDEGRLIAGGSFSSAGGVPAADIAEWTGSAWVPLGDGTPTVYDLDSDGPLLYAACNGTGVRRWNGSEWSIFGTVGTAHDKAISVSGNEVYVVGVMLNAAGAIPSYGIAHWTETAVGIDDRPAPSINSLDQNFPNPFNPVTMIRFQLEEPSRVRLDIFDVRGALVRTLVDGARPAGGNLVTWDGKNDSGQAVSSGVYFYSLSAKVFSECKKMVLLK